MATIPPPTRRVGGHRGTLAPSRTHIEKRLARSDLVQYNSFTAYCPRVQKMTIVLKLSG